MKRTTITSFIFIISLSICAQVKTLSNFDVDGDGEITVSDVTSTVNKVVDKTSEERTMVDAESLNGILQQIINKLNELSALENRLKTIEEKLERIYSHINESSSTPEEHDYPALYGSIKFGDVSLNNLKDKVIAAIEEDSYDITKTEVPNVELHGGFTGNYKTILSGDQNACAYFLLPVSYEGKKIVHCTMFGYETLTSSGGKANVDGELVYVNGKFYRLYAYVDIAVLEDIEYIFGMIEI